MLSIIMKSSLIDSSGSFSEEGRKKVRSVSSSAILRILLISETRTSTCFNVASFLILSWNMLFSFLNQGHLNF